MQVSRKKRVHLPEQWLFESKIERHYDRVENPVSSHSENPGNAEAYFVTRSYGLILKCRESQMAWAAGPARFGEGAAPGSTDAALSAAVPLIR
jgi:hypothetical protein